MVSLFSQFSVENHTSIAKKNGGFVRSKDITKIKLVTDASSYVFFLSLSSVPLPLVKETVWGKR